MQVIKGRVIKPPRILIHGANKVGKTTFGAQAPRPYFILTEDGADDVGADRSELCTTLKAFNDRLREFTEEEHDYETLVIDSVDWLEKLIQTEVAHESGVADISLIKNDYGRCYQRSAGMMSEVLARLDAVHNVGVAIVLIAHSVIKRFDSPEVAPYDRFVPRLHERTCNIVCDWVDMTCFAEQELHTEETDVGFNKKIVRGSSNGQRMLRFDGRPAYIAGNRKNITKSCKLEDGWKVISAALSAGGGQ